MRETIALAADHDVGIGGYEGRQLEEEDTLIVGEASDRTEMMSAEVANEHNPAKERKKRSG